MRFQRFFLACCFLATSVFAAAPTASRSVYQARPEDPEAVYFTPEAFGIKADGRTDVSEALQKAIDQVKTTWNFGILFIPEGRYLISKTITIPSAVRVIGYGKQRPEIILGKNAPGFQVEDPADKGRAKYMFWFVSSAPGKPIQDAHAGTFYSALSNIDLRIEDGNPAAVALRTHFAQHSFISHVDIHIGRGKAGLFDIGNEMEDVRFFGGDYGIYTTKASPGWQFMMVDTHFEGQRRAAIRTQEAGLTIVRMTAKRVPTVIEVEPGYWEKLFMEDCRFEEVAGPALHISEFSNAHTQISVINLDCRQVGLFAKYREGGREVAAPGPIYKVKRYLHGLQMADLDAAPEIQTIQEMEVLRALPAPVATDLPALPPMERWANLRALGAKGDGATDDTKAIQAAIDRHPVLYVPQGWYRVSEPIRLKPETVLIGLNPISTQFQLVENAEAFGGFGAPQALLEAPRGGTNLVNGIGLSTGISNPRAVGCKWMAGAKSYMNDVKFIGGHGSMAKGPQKGPQHWGYDIDPAWDTQHWSLWITEGGGGVFKDIWSASTYAASGLYVSDTSTEGRIYAMSVEHHVRNEVRFKRVSNWKVYALQLEEENRESPDCQPLELEACSNLRLANFYTFRVIRVNTPYPWAIRTWGCRDLELLNVHNYTQMKYTTDLPLYDLDTDRQVRPWEFNRLWISGKTPRKEPLVETPGRVQRLATGFEFANGASTDSKGNVYFCEARLKRVYKWSPRTQSLSLVADFPWEPIATACDAQDQLLVVFKYWPRPGYLKEGKPEVFTNPADAEGTSFSGWGNSGFAVWVYAVDPERPEASIRLLDKVPMGTVKQVRRALYPANRWRDSHDFERVILNRATECYVAQDGETIFPICYDFARCTGLVEAVPGRPVLFTDEYGKRTTRLAVAADGSVSAPATFAEKGEFSCAVDKRGDVYIADGQIHVFDPSGKAKGLIETPERPVTLAFGGPDGETLFITSRTSLYAVQIQP